MNMEYKKLLKVLLTILTIVLTIVVPIWIGPGIIDGEKNFILLEWVQGVIIMIIIGMIGAALWWIFKSIYTLWDEIIN